MLYPLSYRRMSPGGPNDWSRIADPSRQCRNQAPGCGRAAGDVGYGGTGPRLRLLSAARDRFTAERHFHEKEQGNDGRG